MARNEGAVTHCGVGFGRNQRRGGSALIGVERAVSAACKPPRPPRPLGGRSAALNRRTQRPLTESSIDGLRSKRRGGRAMESDGGAAASAAHAARWEKHFQNLSCRVKRFTVEVTVNCSHCTDSLRETQ